MKTRDKTDWVNHLLGILCMIFIWFCVLVVKESKAYHDEINAPKPEPTVYYGPKIPKCDKELWLRIKDGCP